jgi:fluoride exporter
MHRFLLVALGGAVGACLRYAVVLGCTVLGISGPIGIFIINAVGSFALGAITGALPAGSLQLFLAMGVCGAFTTFSTYSVQSVGLIQSGRIGSALLYMVGSVVVCVLFAWLGIMLTSHR